MAGSSASIPNNSLKSEVEIVFCSNAAKIFPNTLSLSTFFEIVRAAFSTFGANLVYLALSGFLEHNQMSCFPWPDCNEHGMATNFQIR